MTTGVYSAGTAFLAVVPSFLGVEEAFRDELKKIGVKLDAQLARSANTALRSAAGSAVGHGRKAAEDYSGAFNKTIQKDLRKSIDDVAVWAGSNKSPWNRMFDQVRKDMVELSNEKVGITIDENTFFRSIKNMRDRVKTLEGSAPKAAQFFNAQSVGKRLDSIMGTMEDARARGVQQAEVFAGAFDTQLKETLGKSVSSLRAIDVKIKADATPAEVEIAAVRAALLELSGKTIGVNITSAEAMAELGRLESRLRALDNDDIDVQVRMDARTVANGLKDFQKEADGSADAITKMEKAAHLTMTRLQYLIALGASLGSVFVPAALAAAGAIGFIGTSALAAGSGLGVLALGTSGLGEAVGALNKYSEQQAKSQVGLDSANRRLAGSTDAVTQATRSLGNTRRTVSEGAADAERAVQDAVRGVSRARHDAAVSARDSARQTADAQRDVTRAEAAAKEVRLDLNEAIREARKEMQDLRTELTRNETDQQKAVTEQMAALVELNALKENPRSTEVEIRRAQDSYNEQSTRLLELADKRRELEQEQAEQQKKGIEGDEKVIKARERVAAADVAVGDARVKLRREQEDAAERAVQSGEKIADAQRRVSDAERAQIRQRLDGQYQIASAQSSVIQAARQQETALDRAGVAGGAAMDNLNTAMAKLTPTQQTFARFLFGLKDELETLQAAAADPMLPGFQQAIEMLLPYLPGVAAFIGKIATQLGSMAVQAARALQGPVWQRFFGYIDKTAVPTLQLWAEAGGNIIEGLLELYMALTPFDGQIGGGLLKLSEDFARWASELGKSQGYQEFLEYVRENGPKVVEFLGDLGTLAIRLVEAAMPMGALLLGIADGLVDLANAIPMPILTGLVSVIGLMALGITLLGARIRAAKFKRELGEIFGEDQRRYVDRYAEATGRATDNMGRFHTAVATTSGAALTAKDRIVGMGTAMSTGYGSAVQKYATDTGRATTETGRFGTAMATAGGLAEAAGTRIRGAGTAMGGVRNAASSLAGFLGGPWGVALAAAGLAIGVLSQASADYNGKISSINSSLDEMGKKFTELDRAGKIGTPEAANTLLEIANSNPEMQQAVINLDQMGIEVGQLGKAAAGSKEDLQAVLSALDKEIDLAGDKWRDESNFLFTVFSDDAQAASKRLTQLRQLREGVKQHADEVARGEKVQALFNKTDERTIAMGLIVKNNAGATKEALAGMATAWDLNQMELIAINKEMKAFGTGAEAAAARADGLTAALERQYGAAIKLNESAETWSGTLLNLRESVEANGRTLDINSRAGLSNRDALEAAAQASRNLFIEEVRAGGKLPVVTAAHNKRIEALKKEAERSFGAKSEAADLIAMYGEIDPAITTKYSTENFDKVFLQAQQLRFAQYLLEQGITDPAQAKELWKQSLQTNQTTINMGGTPIAPWEMQQRATGGPIVGPGTGTSDDVPIWASDGEHMLTAAEVAAAGGHEAIYAFRKALMGGVHKHAKGGPIGYGPQPAVRDGLHAYAKGGAIAPFVVDMSMMKLPSMAQAEDVVRQRGGVGGLLGDASGGMGWRWQIAVLRKMFPGIDLYSAFRPGAVTSSGQQSMHAKDGGRAVDVTPEQRIFDYIHDTFGKKTKELIWGGDPSRNIYNGEHYRFSDDLLRRHGPFQGKAGPAPHIHWSFDEGGWLMPGAQRVVNMTGKPEPVLNPAQWAAVEGQNDVMRQLVAQANQAGVGVRGSTFNFEFKDSTLDAARLRSMQQREEALARAGRPR